MTKKRWRKFNSRLSFFAGANKEYFLMNESLFSTNFCVQPRNTVFGGSRRLCDRECCANSLADAHNTIAACWLSFF